MHLLHLVVLAVVVAVAPQLARADVPGRVGRIAFMQGDVQFYSETEPEWKVAYVNEPITSRNSVFTGDGARAEISVGSTTLAMDAGSQVDIQQLDDNTFNANVVRGRVSMRVRRMDPGDVYDVAVPGADFELLRPGRYRIDALDTSSGLTVFAGQATARTDQNAVTIDAGRAVRVAGDANDPDAPAQLLAAPLATVALDEWVVARESRFQDSVAQRYVSPNMTGYEDLDANGQWASDPDVGPVWYPTTYVRADWAPYRYGRWAYVAPWGYTWIDDAPWGFAPFHYGRWLQVGNRWGWVPGAYVARPAYAPALVGFYGGSGFNASFSVGAGPAVGWYPLAPWQRYAPHYTQRAAYINEVNNITIVNPPARFGHNGDWNRERGGTVAPQDAFASQRSISRVAIAASPGLMGRGSPIDPGALPRAVGVPGAVRRGPEGGAGIVHPEFRSPRDFAQREPGRPFERQPERQTVPQAGAPAPRQTERNVLPPNDRRLQDAPRPVGPEAGRPGVVTETPRAVPPGTPSEERVNERANLQQRLPTQPGFTRPAPRADEAGTAPRFAPRVQPQTTGEPGATVDSNRPQGQERSFERPVRETRVPQQPQAAPQMPTPPVAPQAQPRQQTFERPQNFERPQRIEQPQRMEQPQRVEPQQRIEQRAAPVAPVAPPARPPQAPPAPPRVEPKAEQGGPGRLNREQ
jgi:hypothetical protein